MPETIRPSHEDGPYRAFLIGQSVMPTPDNVAQLRVFMEALGTYDSRTAAYGQVWKQYGALSNLLSVARKTDRLMEQWWHTDGAPPVMHKDALDDAVDLLNYTVFFMRNARAFNILGTAPTRPPSPSAVCDRCGGTFLEDPAHPGYVGVHKCEPKQA